MGNIDLRAYVFLDSLQAQYAAFLGTVAQGFLPLAGRRLALRRGLAGHRDQPADRRRPQGDRGQAGHADHRALLRHARDPLARRRRRSAPRARRSWPRSALAETDRIKPRILSSQIIRRIDDHQAQLINRTRHGQMLIPGQTLYVLELEPAAYAALAANEAEKAAHINILEVRAFGSMGRVYLGGEERDIDVGWRAALAAIEGLEGRDAKA